MGRGLSKDQEYQRVYSLLHNIQRELADKGVASVYSDRHLTGQNTDGLRFTVSYKCGHLSNGESVLESQVAINNGEFFSTDTRRAVPRIVELFAAKPEPTFAARINPTNLGFSPKMTALIGAIIGHDYGVRDGRGGTLTSLSITSDGFVICGSTASDGGGAFVGSAEDLDRNLADYRFQLAAENDEDAEEFDRLYVANVKDWR